MFIYCTLSDIHVYVSRLSACKNESWVGQHLISQLSLSLVGWNEAIKCHKIMLENITVQLLTVQM